jgi:Tfp pilus assembly protein PilF
VGLLAGCASDAKREEIKSQVDYHYGLGMASLEDNNLQGALVEFRTATDLDPDDLKAQFALGHVYFSMGDYATARTAMERVLADEPENGEALNYLGNIAEQQGRLDEAVASFRKAIAVPTYATPHFAYRNLARALLAQGKRDEAETALKAAVRRVPEYYPARADLAKLYMDQDRWSAAVEEWQTLLDLVPAVQDARYYLAESYVGAGDAPKAREQLKLFLAGAERGNPLLPDAEDLLRKLGK